MGTKASTSTKHFGSSLLVVNDKLYVAGGKCSINSSNGEPCGGTGCVEVYDEENNTWSVVDQPHIPPNNLGAIEVEGSVYFIINHFLVRVELESHLGSCILFLWMSGKI